MGRAPCCEKVGLKRGRWTAEEDYILTKYIQSHGEGSWRSLPKNAGLLRCGKSCRLRWVNYLKSDLKRGKFSSEEDDVIIRLHASLGNRWSIIAGSLPGRTDNEIKNYWNSHLSRQVRTFRRPISNPIQQLPPTVMDLPKPVGVGNNIDIAPKRRGGRTSRSAMKKNKFYCFSVKKHYSPPPPKLLETTSTGHEFENGGMLLVPMPRTPTLEEKTNINTIVKSSMHLDPHEEEESSLGSIFLDSCFNDMVIDGVDVGPNGGVLQTLGGQTKETENGPLMDPNELKALSEEDVEISKNPETSEHGYFFSSSNSYINEEQMMSWDWDYLDKNGGVEEQDLWDTEREKMLSWLWEDKGDDEGDCTSNSNILIESEIDSEKQNAMVAWLLS